MSVTRLCLFGLLAAVFTLEAAPDIFPLKDIRAGQRGVGRTVFAGARVDEFQVEVLGVLENIGPRESIILAKLSGGPLAETGVMQGMSGSPVYINGKLVGAVALSFPYSKEAIAGIRPIEDMLRKDPASQVAEPARVLAERQSFDTGGTRLEEIATPVSFMGFSAATLEHFAPALRKFGLDPRQGLSGGGRPNEQTLGDPRQLEPGSMISVQLVSGDMSVGADGTITAIDGEKVYAFGHRFLAEGSTNLPFARAEVLALLPNVSSSFKISTAREWMGTINLDHDSAIAGLTGRRANLIPVEIKVGANTYQLRMVNDRVMSPLLLQMAIFSAIDTSERVLGPQTYAVRGHLDFDSGVVQVNDVYSGDIAVAQQVAANVASPVQFALQSGIETLTLRNISLEIAPVERRNQRQIVDLLAPRRARPGEDVELTVVFSGANGVESSEKLRYQIPLGAPAGTWNFTVADATLTNIMEYQAAVGTPQRSPRQVLELLNGLRSNKRAYIRVWRAEPAYTVEGRDLPAPPPSLALILTRAQAGAPLQVNTRGAKMAELATAETPVIVSGTKNIQIEVKE